MKYKRLLIAAKWLFVVNIVGWLFWLSWHSYHVIHSLYNEIMLPGLSMWNPLFDIVNLALSVGLLFLTLYLIKEK